MVRNRAIIDILIDTPERHSEVARLTLESVDPDMGAMLVLGMGRRQRWMALGDVAQEALWEYLQRAGRSLWGVGQDATLGSSKYSVGAGGGDEHAWLGG